MKGELIVVKTNDGSPTLFVPELNEHYHSIHGAFTEAMHVFYKNGLEQLIHKEKINVFEMGFGTGLNTLVTLYFHLKKNVSIYYESIEKFPLPVEILKQISYSEFFIDGYDLKLLESEIKKDNWDSPYIINTGNNNTFVLKKINNDISNYFIECNFFDVIFFDAFGPRAQKEMWQPQILQKMFNGLNEEGFLVTYCANGQMKRDLKKIGFTVKTAPGPPGKREMTIAYK